MKNRLLKNIPAKLFALLTAMLLWMHVATEQKYEHTYLFPLIVEGLPEEYVVGAPLPDSVGVALKGRGKDLIGLFFSEGYIAIDARGVKLGERWIELTEANLKLAGNNVELVGFTISEPIRFFVDRYTNMEVPIESRLVLEPADGFAAFPEKTTFEPSKVIIGGPERLVNSINSVKTTADTVKNLNANTTLAVSISQDFPLLEYTPKKVSARIVIEPLVIKRIDNIAVKVEGMGRSEGRKLDPSTINITFSGTSAEIDSLSRDDIQVVVEWVEGEGRQIRPVVFHPSGVNIVSTDPTYFSFVTP